MRAGDPPALAACWPSPSPPGPPARCAAGCASSASGGVQARTFHSAALRQLQYFWPRAVGGELPRLVERKVQLVAEAAARSRLRLDRTELRDVTGEIEWAKVTQTVPDDYPAAVAKSAPRRPARPGRDRPGLPDVRAAQAGPRRDRLRGRAAAHGRHPPGPARTSPSRSAASTGTSWSTSTRTSVPLQQRLLDLWLGDARQPVRGRRRQPDHLLLHRRHPRLPARLPHPPPERDGGQAGPRLPLHAAGRAPGQRAARPGHRPRRRAPAGAGLPAPGGPRARLHRVRGRAGRGRGRRPAHPRPDRAPGVSAGEIAVLFRINAQSEIYEQALADAGVPYLLRGAERFFERPEVREAVVPLRGAARAGGNDSLLDDAVDLPSQVRAVLGTKGWTADAPGGVRRGARPLGVAGRPGPPRPRTSSGRSPARELSDLAAELRERRGRPARADRRGRHAGLAARGQGPGVGRRVPGRPHRGHAADHLRQDGRADRGGAPAALRRRHPGPASTSGSPGRSSRSPGGRARRRPSRFLDGLRPGSGSRAARGRRRAGAAWHRSAAPPSASAPAGARCCAGCAGRHSPRPAR